MNPNSFPRFSIRVSAACAAALLASTAAQAALLVDFGASGVNISPAGATAVTGSSPVSSGLTGVTLANNPTSAVGSSNFAWGGVTGLTSTGIGSSVNISVSVTTTGGNLAANNVRSIFRNTSTESDFIRDWIGVTQLGASAVDPTLNITVTGLVDGFYEWTSFHYDSNNNQTGTQNWNISSGGPAIAGVLDVVNGAATATTSPLGSPAVNHSGVDPSLTLVPGTLLANYVSFTQQFTVTGGTVVFSLSPTIPAGTAAGASINQVNFAAINGFSLDLIPEPSTSMLSLATVLGLMLRRRGLGEGRGL